MFSQNLPISAAFHHHIENNAITMQHNWSAHTACNEMKSNLEPRVTLAPYQWYGRKIMTSLRKEFLSQKLSVLSPGSFGSLSAVWLPNNDLLENGLIQFF